ncbi:MAG: ORF6N domain-containing protein [Bacteroidia bacterium]|nr:MAG: ORF6N domain-containing protein [Bacteroidia bacterium]
MEEEINVPEVLSDDVILSKVYIIRKVKVMLDRDLAELYGVETKYLKRQVRRNIIRFPEDFMFELTEKELRIWRSQFVTSNKDKMGLRYLPYAFTEDGIAQLSTVLNSESAIKVNLQIIRIFSRLRSMALSHADILLKLEQLEKMGLNHDRHIELIFKYLRQFEKSRQDEVDFKDRPRIGFKPSTGI